MSSSTIAPDLIDRIVENQHRDPFEVLGPHQIEQNGVITWVIRAYLPHADAAWVIRPGGTGRVSYGGDSPSPFF